MVSTKTIPVCDADSLKDGEMSVALIADAISRCHRTTFLVPHTHPICRKEVDFGNGKVLLSKIGDKVHATSAYCTHYGAPLAKGVLVADGRVVWCVDPIALPIYTPN
jgi:nitrite reductase/ring-hydroxylating ferredoxin subunit